jgi:hypothetical protein
MPDELPMLLVITADATVTKAAGINTTGQVEDHEEGGDES